MAKYLARTCPRCRDYLGVVIPEPLADSREVPINAVCLKCGVSLPINKIILGKKPILVLLGFLFLLTQSPPVYPHGGGLDAYGCHHDRKRGGYHCHRGQLAGQSFRSKDEMLKHLKASPEKSPEREKKKSSE